MYRSETLTVRGSPMEVLVFEPEGPGPFPGLVVAQHLPVAHAGLTGDPFTIDVGEKLAENGYVAVIPHVFHWWPADEDIQFRDDETIADLDTTFDFLAGMDKVDVARIGILGHCWGGRIAWLGAASNPRYKAAVMLYGGRVKLAMGGVPAIDLAGDIKCPMLGFFGNEDENPSPEDVNDMDAALTAAGVDHTFYRYDNAGHGFQDDTNPSRYREGPAKDAWEKLLAFFDRELK